MRDAKMQVLLQQQPPLAPHQVAMIAQQQPQPPASPVPPWVRPQLPWLP